MKKTSGIAIVSMVCGLLSFVPIPLPYVNIIISIMALTLGIVAFNKIKLYPEQLDGKGFSIAGIVIGAGGILIVVLVSIFQFSKEGLPYIQKAKVSNNDTLAKVTLFALSTASETYASSHQGKYPLSVDGLTGGNEPLIKQNYCNQTISGFHYDCEFTSDSYRFKAKPETTDTGTEEFTIMTGGIHDWQDPKNN